MRHEVLAQHWLVFFSILRCIERDTHQCEQLFARNHADMVSHGVASCQSSRLWVVRHVRLAFFLLRCSDVGCGRYVICKHAVAHFYRVITVLLDTLAECETSDILH